MQDITPVKLMTMQDQFAFEKPQMMSATKSTGADYLHSVNRYVNTTQTDTNSSYLSGALPGINSLPPQGTSSCAQTTVNNKNFTIGMPQNAYFDSSTMEVQIQCDVSMTSSLANELFQPTSVFGRVYKWENCQWTSEKSYNFQHIRATQSTTTPFATTFAYYGGNVANDTLPTGLATLIVGGQATGTYTGVIGPYTITWTTKTDTTQCIDAITINGISCLTSTNYNILGNLIQISSYDQTKGGLNIAINGYCGNAATFTAPAPATVVGTSNSMNLLLPGYCAEEYQQKTFVAPIMMNTTGLINEAQFQAGNMNVSKNLVYKRGYPQQRAIPPEVQQKTFTNSMFDHPAHDQIPILDTRYYNYMSAINGVLSNPVIGSAGNTQFIKYLCSTDQRGLIQPPNGDGMITNSQSVACSNGAYNGYVKMQAGTWDLLPCVNNNSATALAFAQGVNALQYWNDGWSIYIPATNPTLANIMINYTKQMTLSLPLWMVFPHLQIQKFLTSTIANNAELKVNLWFNPYNIAAMIGSPTKLGPANYAFTDMTNQQYTPVFNVPAITNLTFPLIGSSTFATIANTVPVISTTANNAGNTKTTSLWGRITINGLPFLDPSMTGITKLRLYVKQVYNPEFCAELRNITSLHLPFEDTDYNNFSQQSVMQYLNSVNIQSSHASVIETLISATFIDGAPTMQLPSMYYKGFHSQLSANQMTEFFENGCQSNGLTWFDRFQLSFAGQTFNELEVRNIYQQLQTTKQSLNQFANFRYSSAIGNPSKYLMLYGQVIQNNEQENLFVPFNLIMDGQNTKQNVIKMNGQICNYNQFYAMEGDQAIKVLSTAQQNQYMSSTILGPSIQVDFISVFSNNLYIFPSQGYMKIDETIHIDMEE